jgi:DNA-binding response OmpR family regulator
MDAWGHLLIRAPGGHEATFLLCEPRIVIGRSSTCDLLLDGSRVSRHHAVLERRAEAVFVCDQASTNGLYVDGQRVSGEHRLNSGSVFELGDYAITYRNAGEEDQTTQESSVTNLLAGVVVDANRWEVWVEGKKRPRLSENEFVFMKALYDRRGAVCARDELTDLIWPGGDYPYFHLHRLVRRVRVKVEADPGSPQYIESVPGVGYRLARTFEDNP